MTEPQYTVGTDDRGRFWIVDQVNGHPIRFLRYTDEERAKQVCDRFNAIMTGSRR